MDMLIGYQKNKIDNGDKQNVLWHDRKYFLKKWMLWGKLEKKQTSTDGLIDVECYQVLKINRQNSDTT